MKQLTIATVLAAALLTIGPLAQSAIGPVAQNQAPNEPTLPPQPTVKLSLEQRHVIKEIVKDLKLKDAAGNVPLKIGDTVPQTVTLSPMPELISQKVPQVKSHTLFVKDGQIVLVSPNDHKVSEVIEARE